MFDKIFPTSALIAVAVLTLFGFLLGLAVGDWRKRRLEKGGLSKADASKEAKYLSRAVEGGICALVGGVLARLVFGYCLDGVDAFDGTGEPTKQVTSAALTLLWAGVPILGVVDTIAWLADDVIFSTPTILLWIVMAIGGVTGAANGAGRIYPWVGVGIPALLLDVTWGLAGSGLGLLLHLINIPIDKYKYAYDDRKGAHRFDPGFRLVGNYAFTQGSVISNTGVATPDEQKLYKHELPHVWQARLFGPFFPITYALWAVVFFFPGIIVAAARSKSIGAGIFTYSYLNNPWEFWAYKVGGNRNAGAEPSMLWQGKTQAGWTIGFFAAVAAVSGLVVWAVWG